MIVAPAGEGTTPREAPANCSLQKRSFSSAAVLTHAVPSQTTAGAAEGFSIWEIARIFPMTEPECHTTYLAPLKGTINRLSRRPAEVGETIFPVYNMSLA